MAKASSWQATMDKYKAHAWSKTNEFVTTGTSLWSLLIPRLSTIQSKTHCSFSVKCLNNYCWPVYHSQPLEQLQSLQYSKLQMAKYPSWQSAMHGQIQSTYMKCIQGETACIVSLSTAKYLKLEFSALVHCLNWKSIGIKPSTIMTTWGILT